jgi:hypothetical protein
MAAYTPPLRDMDFVLHDVLEVEKSRVPGYAELDRGFTAAILEEAGKIASEVLAPLNAVGDREGCVLENGVVRTPEGFREAFDTVREGGWTTPPTAARASPTCCTPRSARWRSRPTWPSTCTRA